MQMAVLIITALDLGVAQEGLIDYAPASEWSATPRVVGELAAELGTSRVYRQLDTVPESWSYTQSNGRFVEWLLWWRDSCWPKFPLPYGIKQAAVQQTIAGSDYHILLEVARTQNRRQKDMPIPHASILDLVAARFGIVETKLKEEVTAPREIADSMYLGERPTALPRAWTVHEVEVVPPLVTRSPTAHPQMDRRAVFPRQ